MKSNEVKCPFCLGYFFIDQATNPSTGKQADMLIHNLPPCPKFLALEPEDFVHEAYMKAVPQA